ncbi:DegT/DnrJ/EryC1/StrS family aminotransferase [Nibricoccus sp. IMCC34717]|uniref:DegT/DnrJ/EryC1/StrS family aminotransferase n=1 Tax=Nibricoccus sp. IMCC34717 TaxID=3034021 RepID=UPI00384D5691
MKVPLQDLARSARELEPELNAACARVVRSGWFVLGQEVALFEKEFAAWLGADQVVSVANGTDALELALRAVGVSAGDDVLQAANAGMYGTVATLAVGAHPVYADIDPVRLSPRVEDLEKALTPLTRAVIVTHLHGWAADLAPIADWCRTKGLALIEDCAESHGASVRGKTTGTWGDVGCFSFYPTKNLGALGDGGACSTQSESIAQRLRLLRQYGWERRYQATLPGGRNSRLDEMQAALLRVKLPRLSAWNARRRVIAERYRHGFAGLPIETPDSAGPEYVGHLYVVKVGNRDAVRTRLQERGVATDVHFPVPDYRQPAIAPLLRAKPHLPETERASERILTLPCFPELADSEVDHVVASVQAAVSP